MSDIGDGSFWASEPAAMDVFRQAPMSLERSADAAIVSDSSIRTL
jgi:hypothetical protein